MSKLYQVLLLVSLVLFFPLQILFPQFLTIETKDERLVYYGGATSYIVNYVGACTENALKYNCNLFDYTPSEKLTVLVHDLNDYGNAGASTIPRNIVALAIAPANFVFETAPSNERINSTMNHELVHIATLDEAANTDNFYRSIFFGKVAETSENPLTMIYSYLTNPRRATPRWYREGIAVFLETWMAGGLGRALGGYDEMVFRTIVKDSGRIYDLIGLESEGTQTDFQVEVNAYLYGTRFMSYVSYLYGPEKLIEWTARKPGSNAYFASQFEKIYGLSLNDAWDNWIKWEYEFQKNNLEKIRKNPVSEFRSLSNETLGSLSRSFYDKKSNKIYAAINYPGQTAYIASIDNSTGEVENISDIKGPALYFVSSIVYDEKNETIFYTTDNNDWRDLMSVDLKTGKSEMLIKEGRIGDLAFNKADSSLWGIRHYNGISTIVRISYPYSEWNQIYSWPYGRDMYDIDISNNGKYLTGALAEINGTQLLIKMDINKLRLGDTYFDTLFNFETSLPANFVFSDDDKFLYGSSYYSGVSNIYRYGMEDGSINILTNCETGLFRPLPFKEDSLIAFAYTSKGFTPVVISNKPIENVAAINFLGQQIVENHPVIREWIAPAPAPLEFESGIIYNGNYNGLTNIGIASAYPIVEGYKKFVSYGMRFNISDPVGFHNFTLTASYSPNNLLSKDERLHLGFEYSYFNWEFNATLNNSDFYDLFGPTKVSRKGYSLGLKYKQNLIYDTPQIMDFTIYSSFYGDLERLPDYQNVEASFDKLFNFGASFSYKDMRSSLGAVDYEKGFKWEINSNNNYVRETVYPHIHNDFDYGFALPINHSSIWFRTSVGYSYGDRDEPFANFFFGGFGNNYVDNLPEKRYREHYSFPGVELNAINGTNYGKLIFEWNLPPIRFSNLGFASFYINYARTSLFTSGIVTNVDSKELRQNFYNVGAQVDFKMILFFHLKMTLSFGYAAAVQNNQRATDELMVSVKVL